MASPPVMSPGQRAAGATPPPGGESSVTPKEALDALEGHVSESDDPTKAQQAIQTLRNLFDTSGPDRQDRQQSPGQRAAASAGPPPGGSSVKSSAAARFGGR